MKKIGLFYDKFDPVTEKVVSQAIFAHNKLDLDEIWFLIPEDNPDDHFLAPFEKRVDMLAASIEENKYYKILPVKNSDIYNNKELKRLHKEDKSLSLYLIINSRSYLRLTRDDQFKFLKWVDLILINDEKTDNINPQIKTDQILEDRFNFDLPDVRNGDFKGIPKPALKIIVENKLYL